jgi:hypothetical protein
MSKIGPNQITKQPQNDEIHNGFGIMGNEILLKQWKFEETTLGCSTIYHMILTDTRLLIRKETTGCCDSDHTDFSVFLRDIAEIRESSEGYNCCPFCTCCCRAPKVMKIRGAFGSHTLHIPKAHMASLQIEIPAAIGNHKLVHRPHPAF